MYITKTARFIKKKLIRLQQVRKLIFPLPFTSFGFELFLFDDTFRIVDFCLSTLISYSCAFRFCICWGGRTRFFVFLKALRRRRKIASAVMFFWKIAWFYVNEFIVKCSEKHLIFTIFYLLRFFENLLGKFKCFKKPVLKRLFHKGKKTR